LGVKALDFLKPFILLALPVAARRKIGFAQDYFDSSSIRKAVTLLSDRDGELQDDVQKLLAILRENNFMPDVAKIETAQA